MQNREQQTPARPSVKNWIELVSHDKDQSNVDEYEQAMLSTKTEERPTKKARTKQKEKQFF